jgi:hypothetical protein
LQKAIKKVEDADLEFFSLPGKEISSFNSNMLKLIDGNKTK